MDRKVELRVTPGGYLALAAGVLFLPLPWLLAGVSAAVVHEGCHYAAIRLCRKRVYSICIGPGKAVMETEPMEEFQQLLCAAAGPVGSFLMLAFAKTIPSLALCGLIQGLFNLCPVLPMDGGRVVHSALVLLSPRYGEPAARWVQFLFVFFLIILGSWGIVWLKTAFFLLPLLVILASKAVSLKNTLQRSERTGTIGED